MSAQLKDFLAKSLPRMPPGTMENVTEGSVSGKRQYSHLWLKYITSAKLTKESDHVAYSSSPSQGLGKGQVSEELHSPPFSVYLTIAARLCLKSSLCWGPPSC